MTRVLEIPVRVPPPDSVPVQVDAPAVSPRAASDRFADALHQQLLAQDTRSARESGSLHESALAAGGTLHESGLPHMTMPLYEPGALHASAPRHEPDSTHESMPSHALAQGSERPRDDLSCAAPLPMTGEVAQPAHRATVVWMPRMTAQPDAPSGMPAATGGAARSIDLRALRAEIGSHPVAAHARVATMERSGASTAVVPVPQTGSSDATVESGARSRDGAAASLQTVLTVQGRTAGPLLFAANLTDVAPGGAKGLPGAVLPEPQAQGTAEQKLVRALGERLHVHVTRRAEQATIRLDPPHMGTIDIDVRHEAGSVQVYLRASHAEVARQLHAIGDSLRQDLAQRQSGEVSVFVYDASREGEGRQRQRQTVPWSDDPGRALDVAHDGERSGYFTLLPDEE